MDRESDLECLLENTFYSQHFRVNSSRKYKVVQVKVGRGKVRVRKLTIGRPGLLRLWHKATSTDRYSGALAGRL